MPTPRRVPRDQTGTRVAPSCASIGAHGWSGRPDQTQRGAVWRSYQLLRSQRLGANFRDLADEYGSCSQVRTARAAPRTRQSS
jgi:hypothetical protein